MSGGDSRLRVFGLAALILLLPLAASCGSGAAEAESEQLVGVTEQGSTTSVLPFRTDEVTESTQPPVVETEIDPVLKASLLTALDLGEAGFRDDWSITAELWEEEDEDDICDLNKLGAPGAVYADADPGFSTVTELEQVVSRGSGPVGVEVIRNLIDCPAFASEVTGTLSISPLAPAGSTDSVVLEGVGERAHSTWAFADYDGTLIGIFYTSNHGSRAEDLVKLIELIASRL